MNRSVPIQFYGIIFTNKLIFKLSGYAQTYYK